jgi:uncharacterized membrane protein
MEYASLLLVHVFFGIVWAGGAVTAGLFLVPSVLEAGPAGGAVMAGIMKRRFSLLMSVSSLLVVLSGARLYSVLVSGAWIATNHGIVLTLGSLAGLGAFVIGLFVQRPTAEKLGALSAQIAASGSPPTPEQSAELERLRKRLGTVARVTAWHLVAAALLMSGHRLAAML